MKKLLSVSLATLLLAGTAAYASSPADDHRMKRFEERFSALDTNNDGQISKEELSQTRAELFSAADANGDGALSFEEYRNYVELQREHRMQKQFSRLDRDGSGSVSFEDLNRRRDAMFDKWDTNNDGFLSKEEMLEGMKQYRGKRHHRG